MSDLDKLKQKLGDEIDTYETSVLAILGFQNFFRFNDGRPGFPTSAKTFQGRRMQTTTANKVSPNSEVTPDLCIQLSEVDGIVAEVKYAFPKDREQWIDDFKQLLSYDDDLENWLTSSKRIKNHDIVLLPEQSRSVALKEYYEELQRKGDLRIARNFVIIEFNRSDQGQPYLFFRTHFGSIKTDSGLASKLREGIKVPLEKLLSAYSKCKLYDSAPPGPLLLNLIWEILLERASSDKRFPKLRKNSRLEVSIRLDDLVQELSESYSFKPLNGDHEHQPTIPPKSWIRDAINTLVAAKEARWDDDSHETAIVSIRRYENTLDTFKELWLQYGIDSESERNQLKLL